MTKRLAGTLDSPTWRNIPIGLESRQTMAGTLRPEDILTPSHLHRPYQLESPRLVTFVWSVGIGTSLRSRIKSANSPSVWAFGEPAAYFLANAFSISHFPSIFHFRNLKNVEKAAISCVFEVYR